MTTNMTPMSGDAERWLPDPSWPVPPRGWQLWAAAGPAARSQGAPSDGLDVRAQPEMPHTDGVLSEIDRFAAFEDASFTLPTRPSLLVDHPAGQPVRVDLLAESRSVRRAPHRAPAGMVRGFAALAVLLVISFLVGGVTGALVVIGVSTLLAASAALVSGHISLSLVGGQRGAGLFLGVAVVALMAASVMPRDRPARQDEVATALVPVSSNWVPDTLRADAAVPPSPVASSSRVVVAPAAPSASGAEIDTSAPAARSLVDGGVPTLSPDALTPGSGRASVPGSSKTAKPVKPVKPDKPVKAAKPAKTSKPEKASRTGKPERPAHPAATCTGRTGAAPVVLRRALAALGPCGPVRQ